MTTPQILIAGAGPTGLVLALRLTRHGIPIRIVSAASGPGEASRAMVVHARTLELYAQLGFAEAVVGEGIRATVFRVGIPGQNLAAIHFDGAGRDVSPYPFVLAFPQDDHERLLVAQLARMGVEIEWDTELVGLEQDAQEVRATLRHGGTETVQAVPYLVGCDGAHSQVRHSLGLTFLGGGYDQLFYVADVEIAGGFRPDLQITLGDTGFAMLLPVRSRGVQRLIGVAPPGTQKGASFEDVRKLAEELAGVQVINVNWFSTYFVNHRVAGKFRKGRCFVAGDAGHVHSPAGGQGMNTGIGDAVNLSWKLAHVLQGRAAASVLDTYETERIAFARKLVSTTDRAFRAIVASSWAAIALRRFMPRLMGLATRLPAVQRRLFGLVSQVRIAYRGSVLSEGRAGRIAGGDRLPWVAGPEGGNFAPLRSVDWQMHVHGAVPPAVNGACEGLGLPVHRFAWSEAARAAGYARDAAYLVRPDGYVGLALRDGDIGRLMAYAARVGLAA